MIRSNSSPQRRRDAEAQRMEINQITEKIIGAAIEIHRTLGAESFGIRL